MLQCPAFKIVEADGLVFTIMDYAALTADEDLGSVRLSPGELLTEGGLSQVHVHTRKVKPPKDSDQEDAGYLTIRVRKATTEDEVSLINGENKRFFAVEKDDGVTCEEDQEDQAAVMLM